MNQCVVCKKPGHQAYWLDWDSYVTVCSRQAHSEEEVLNYINKD